MEIVIGPNGPPANVAIGTQATTIEWKCAGSGSVTSVSRPGNNSSCFSNGRRDGNNYKWDYLGSARPPNLNWSYTVDSSCSTTTPPPLDTYAASLNNGSP